MKKLFNQIYTKNSIIKIIGDAKRKKHENIDDRHKNSKKSNLL